MNILVVPCSLEMAAPSFGDGDARVCFQPDYLHDVFLGFICSDGVKMTLLQADNEAEGDGDGDPALEVETKRLCFFSPNWSPIVRRQCSLPSGYPSQERKRRQTDLQVLQNQKSHLGILHGRRVIQESPAVLPNKPQMHRDPKIQ